MQYQPRYIAYCNFHDMTPDQMLTHDRSGWPGGCMTGYILWISERVAAFRQEHPDAFVGCHISDHDKFTEYLLTTPAFADQVEAVNKRAA